MLGIYNILNRYKSISIERINDFLTRNGIEHQCTEFGKIEFKLEDWKWDLYIENNYFRMVLVFSITEDTIKDRYIDCNGAEEACLEITKQIKFLKAHYSSHKYKDNDNRLKNYNILIFNFESYCYNMYDFSKIFYDGLNIILVGYKEYQKIYDEIESKLTAIPIGFRNSDGNNKSEKSKKTNRHRIGYV